MSALRNLALDAFSILLMLVGWAILMICLPVGSWSSVVLYNGIANGIVPLAVLGLFVFFRRKERSLDTKLLVVSNGGLAVLLVLVLGPVSIDRSLSLYLLNQIDRFNGAVTQIDVDRMISETYPDDMNVGIQRVVEQIHTGNLLDMPDGRIILTERGRTVIRVTNVIRKAFVLNPLPE